MNDINDGGPAFPGFNYVSTNVHEGMDLRDYFAAKAMQGYLIQNTENFEPVEFASAIAEHSYILADAMIKARRKYEDI